MPNNRRRGANYEREVARHLAEMLGLDMERGARNGVKGGEDVMGWSGVRLECKRRRAIALCRALEQAEGDAEATDALPLVVAREDRGRHVLLLRLDDLPRLVERYAKALGRPVYPDADNEQDVAAPPEK